MSYPKQSKAERIITITDDPKTWPKQGDFIVAVDWLAKGATTNSIGYGFVHSSGRVHQPYNKDHPLQGVYSSLIGFYHCNFDIFITKYRVLTRHSAIKTYQNVASVCKGYHEWAFYMTDAMNEETEDFRRHMLRSYVSQPMQYRLLEEGKYEQEIKTIMQQALHIKVVAELDAIDSL